MSTARAHHKSNREGKEPPAGHPFRNALVISLALAALILWQLSFIIHGLNTLASTLVRAQSTRQVIADFLKVAYHKVIALALPLIHRLTH